MTDRERLQKINDTIEAIFGCQGWTEALQEPGSVADWMGPRLYAILDLAKPEAGDTPELSKLFKWV